MSRREAESVFGRLRRHPSDEPSISHVQARGARVPRAAPVSQAGIHAGSARGWLRVGWWRIGGAAALIAGVVVACGDDSAAGTGGSGGRGASDADGSSGSAGAAASAGSADSETVGGGSGGSSDSGTGG